MDRKFLSVCLLILCSLRATSAEPVQRPFDQEIPVSIITTRGCSDSLANNEFQKLIEHNGTIYVGATNTILQLSSNLEIQSRFQSGPGNDSVACGGPPSCDTGNICQDNLECADNYNKILLPYRNRILACGTLHAVCDMLELHDISRPYGSITTLQCKTSTLRQFVSVGSRIRNQQIVGSIRVNQEHPDQDLLYLGQPGHFIRVLYAPSSTYSYFTEVDNFVETPYNMVTNYHLAWTTEAYGYLLWTNRTTEETKLSRYCNSIMSEANRASYLSEVDSPVESGARTYTEISLQCQNGLSSPINVVAAQFMYNQLFILYQDNDKTALCSANITLLNEKFDRAREGCWNADNQYAKYVYPSANCSRYLPYESEWNTCGIPEIEYTILSGNGLSVAGRLPVDLTSVMTRSFVANEKATSFTLGFDNGLYFVFVGTTAGEILKIRLGGDEPNLIERVVSGGNEALLDSLVMDEENNNLYTISKTSIFRVRVANCEQYQTCTSCVESLDPNCGWCVQESRCTRKNACKASDQAQRWIGPTADSDLCPRVSMVEPNIISVGPQQTRVGLTFSGSSLLDGLPYTCEFSSIQNLSLPGSPLENFSGENGTGSCFFPKTTPEIIPFDSDHNNITLHVVYNQRTLASGNFRVYQCSSIRDLNQYSMCTSCVTSEWGCSWCAGSGTCNNSSTCANQLVTNSSTCPVVIGYNLNTSTFIPVGKPMTFYLGTLFLPGPDSDFMCQYNFCGKSEFSVAYINPSSDVAECTVSAQLLTCNRRSSTIQVILRRDDYVIDTSAVNSTTGKLYNCSAESIGSSCTRCMGFRRECEQCVWCPSTRQCVDRLANCSSDVITDITDCENPVIESISPTSGPVEGGTLVTINGQNLGSTASDIAMVRVGKVDCEILPQFYISSVRVVCLTMSSLRSNSGQVKVITSYGRDARSKDVFTYRNAMVDGIRQRPVLDQSVIEVFGRQLNIGNNASIHFVHNESLFTICAEREKHSMLCQLPSVESPGNYSVTIKLDGYSSNFSNNLVQIVRNPNVEAQGDLVAFRGAGGTISFKLSSLIGVDDVKLEIGEAPQQKCEIDEEMLLARCHISPLTSQSSRSRRQAKEGGSRDATLVLNGVYRVSLGPVTYFDDPSLSQLTVLPCHSTTSGSTDNTTSELAEGSTRTIEVPGRNFDSTKAPKSAYTVTLSSTNAEQLSTSVGCNVTFIESSLFCRASSSDLSAFTNQRITINVNIGELNLTVSDVQYCTEDRTAIIAVSITVPIVIFLLFVILFLLIRQKKRVQKRDRERKIIMQKLDDLENKTREKARNAYYELQVGYMNTLSENITHRITYRSPELYFVQTLFSSRDHPFLDNAGLGQETAPVNAVGDWMRLLSNKDFLMTFIRTLDEQKKFTVQEKGNVASLLVVCLFADMPYFTSIMFDLLAELIQKQMHKNPKLLLRSSGSVVEKMVSHWLSVTLYDDCIMGSCGEPVFLLTKAIHYLVNSAPCDVIANKSVNSLNESTLLSTEINYTSKTILASIREENGNACKPVEISVIDVDSITQVKQKIIDEFFKDKPFSESPDPEKFDLEMLGTGDLGEGIVLSDIDYTSEKKDNVTKINTLKHYHVNDRTRLVLRPAGTLKTVSQDSRTPLLNGNHSENGNRVYHLVDEESQINKGFIEEIADRPFQEIFLTRMVRSKSTLQDYVDGVFKSILSPDSVPLAVRYLFQFLDREAARHRISDAEMVHIWKANSLLLRYWVNILKNPEFIFDIKKTSVVDSCLSVITQAFMDACSADALRKLNQGSPSNKLLYAKDVEHYQKMVNEFFLKISNTPWIGEKEFEEALKQTSRQYARKFNPQVACQQLYQYLFKYKEQVITAIRNDENEDLARTVERVARKMEGKNVQTTQC